MLTVLVRICDVNRNLTLSITWLALARPTCYQSVLFYDIISCLLQCQKNLELKCMLSTVYLGSVIFGPWCIYHSIIRTTLHSTLIHNPSRPIVMLYVWLNCSCLNVVFCLFLTMTSLPETVILLYRHLISQKFRRFVCCRVSRRWWISQFIQLLLTDSFSFPRQTDWKLAWNALNNAVVIVTCIWQPPVVTGLLTWTSQLRTGQPSIFAIQVWHIAYCITCTTKLINTAARLVRAHLDFCTSWGQTQWFLLF